MSVHSMRTAVRRLTQAIIPRGEVIAIRWHPCQAEAARIEAAENRLGRRLRPGDVVVWLESGLECPAGAPRHDEETTVIYARMK